MARHGAALLCIDDDPAGLKVRKLLLENFGFKVTTTTSGREGLALLSSRNFDAVLVDYQMPGMNGVQVATAVRKLRPHIPILMLSAYASLPPTITKSVNTFVSKMEPTSYLVAKIEQLLNIQPNGDPVWVLGAAVATTALLGLVVYRFVARVWPKHDGSALSEA